MSQSPKHPVRDRVVGGLILAGLLWLATRIPGLLPGVWSFIKSSVRWFFLSHASVPIWLVVTLSLAALGLLLVVLRRVIRFFSTIQEPSWQDYKEDNFFGMTWRWSYWRGGIQNLWCFCPEDDTTLVYGESFSHERVHFICETCGTKFGPHDGDKDSFVGKVERQIERKVRSGEWKAVVQRFALSVSSSASVGSGKKLEA